MKNGEEYVMICDMGQPLTVRDRNSLRSQLQNATDKCDIIDEWTDESYKYYLKIRIKNNPFWGIIILLAMATVSAYMIGRSLAEVLVAVGDMTVKSFPIAIVGLVGIAIIVGYKWLRQRRN